MLKYTKSFKNIFDKKKTKTRAAFSLGRKENIRNKDIYFFIMTLNGKVKINSYALSTRVNLIINRNLYQISI